MNLPEFRERNVDRDNIINVALDQSAEIALPAFAQGSCCRRPKSR